MARDFTPDGQRNFENILKYDELIRNGFSDPEERVYNNTPTKQPKLTPEQKEIEHFRIELCKMINNSQMVIEDCQVTISQLETAEEYIKSDAKVAITLHSNLINRLSRILNLLPAFDNEDHLTLNVAKLKNHMNKRLLQK